MAHTDEIVIPSNLAPMPKKRTLNVGWLLASFPFVLVALFVATYPFADTLTSKTFSTSILTPAQRSNIELAAESVNGKVLKPGETFSFNHIVGPRTAGRGYRPAPSYLGKESPATIGGGVCLVSSAIYQLALEAGLEVDERVPHLRTIRTVPPGLDATVWYGQADLRFKNTLPYPVQLTTDWNNRTFSISLMGRKPKDFHTAKLERVVTRSTRSEIVVELLRQQGDRLVVISRDHYDVAN
jgi:vancomycin resistance protein VanW